MASIGTASAALGKLPLTPSTGTLRPCPDESVDWDSTQNLMIEGDNLEVLKLLQKSYAGKVKLIYIDPPYNTGKDFVYPDNFQDNIKNYLELTGQVEGGRKITSNAESSGRFHTDWLNMMYPRLKLARNLLKTDGVIFISIDDNEVSNLRKICDEVFGEENFIANVVWQKKYAATNDAKGFSNLHDHIIVYQKSNDFERRLLPRTEEQNKPYKNDDGDGKGLWRSDNLLVKSFSQSGVYPITNPNTSIEYLPPEGSSWRASKETMTKWLEENRIYFGKEGAGAPQLKRYLNEVQDGRVPTTWWKFEDVGHNDAANKEVSALFGAKAPFDTPKPSSLIRQMLSIATTDKDLILDFFAGSATTAHAVMQLNAEDNGNRKFILVQLPEPCDENSEAYKAGFSTIAEISKERIRRAGQKIKTENALIVPDLDTGFRVFKLDSSNIHAWEPNRDDLAETLLQYAEHLKTDRTEQDILFELLLKLGLDLTIPIEQKIIADKTVHGIGSGVLLACLAPQINNDEVEPLALGIAKWHKQLSPAGETQIVFRDSAFTDDVAKTNLTAILQQHGLAYVRSL